MALTITYGTRFTPAAVATGVSAGSESQDAIYWDPDFVDNTKPMVIYCGGGGTLAHDQGTSSGGGQVVLELTLRGYAILQPSVPWLIGNSESVSRIADAVAYGIGPLHIADHPPILAGVSNGAICSVQYALANPVLGLLLMNCPVDVEKARNGDEEDLSALAEAIGDFDTKVNEAWGITADDPLPPEANIVDFAADLWMVRGQMWVSSDDPFSPNEQISWGNQWDADVRNLGRLNHSSYACNSIPADDAADFVDRCAATV